MGGWMWGGAEDRDSLATIRRAIELGVNLIDTAPIYGHGRSEEIVGRALQESGQRDRLILATKVGLNWDPEQTRVWRDSSRARIGKEVEDSLRRLRTDYIDIYQVHWPDLATPFEESMEALVSLQEQGRVRVIGVSNFDVAQIDRCRKVGPVQVLQPPYNMFERGIEREILPYCRRQGLGVLAYSPLCRGLLTGKYEGHETFSSGDVRSLDPKFQHPAFGRYVACVKKLSDFATHRRKTLAQLAVRWCLDQPGVTVALCGARRPDQIEESVGAAGWSLSQSDMAVIDRVISETITHTIGPEFMAPASVE